MSERILEESQRPDGMVMQTRRKSDGTEYVAEAPYVCTVCGAHSNRPFSDSALSCFREECNEGW